MPHVSKFHLKAEEWVGIAAITTVVVMAGASFERSASLRADVESVCVAVTVVGVTAGDPGESYCNPPAFSEESSSSSSVASSTSSSVASASSSIVPPTGEEVDDGARRGTIPQSRSRIVRLIRLWTQRNTLHAAPSGQWYDRAVQILRERGYIDDTEDLRLSADATRAEVAKIVVLFSIKNPPTTDVSSFDDALVHAWYAPFIEQAAYNGWMLGYGDCYGRRPCYFRPAAVITRAEAAAVLVRVFSLNQTHAAPVFDDVPSYAWYRGVIQAAADACILQENDRAVRPDDRVTRAEFFVMFERALEKLQYGKDCGDVGATPSTQAGIDSDNQTETERYVCSRFIPACLLEAAKADFQTFIISPFAGALSMFDPRVWVTAPLSESATWLVFLGVPLVGVYFLQKRIRRPTKEEESILVKK